MVFQEVAIEDADLSGVRAVEFTNGRHLPRNWVVIPPSAFGACFRSWFALFAR